MLYKKKVDWYKSISWSAPAISKQNTESFLLSTLVSSSFPPRQRIRMFFCSCYIKLQVFSEAPPSKRFLQCHNINKFESRLPQSFGPFRDLCSENLVVICPLPGISFVYGVIIKSSECSLVVKLLIFLETNAFKLHHCSSTINSLQPHIIH